MSLVESQESRVKSRERAVALRLCSGSRLVRRGITLIELLITILIIGILAGLILGVAAVAAETAREAQTRHVVTRLHNLLMERYDTYKTRRVRLRPEVEQAIANSPGLPAAEKGQAIATARLYALRELMLMEMPDRWSDILLTNVPSTNAASVTPRYPVYLDVRNSLTGRTALSSVYLRRYSQVAQNASSAGEVDALLANQGAECLYMIITLATGDGEARSLFGESSIGDTDGDGAPEFLDGWGHPIEFLRWAPGFDSQIQINAETLGGNPPKQRGENATWESAAGGDHDPFDIYRVDVAAFRLVPLVYSAGRDEEYGIRRANYAVVWPGIANTNAPFNAANPRQLLPHQQVTDPPPGDGSVEYLGIATDATATDNVHNHLLGQR